VWALSSLAWAAGTAPEDRLELQAELGVVTARPALAVGAGGGVRERGLTVLGAAAFGARGDWFGTGSSRQPGFGLATVQLGLDTPAGSSRFGVAALVDAVLIETIEEGCGRAGCRHGWFWGADDGLGVGVQPAYGLRVAGAGGSGAAFATFLGVQPYFLYTEPEVAPRLDLAVYGRTSAWSIHAWAGRYGLGFGVGRRLSAPQRAEPT
jgi:hypothetical protein